MAYPEREDEEQNPAYWSYKAIYLPKITSQQAGLEALT
jgi:hypothetical protein